MISRRTFIATVVPATVVGREIAFAQPPRKVHQVGVLISVPTATAAAYLDALRAGLRDLGYVEGRNVVLVVRSSGDLDRQPELARELVSLNVNVIVTGGPPGILAAKQATSTIPIIIAAAGDPVKAGYVASFARPGGNVTGLSMRSDELSSKHLELLKEALPNLSRVGVLWDPLARGYSIVPTQQVSDAARMLGVRVQSVEARAAPDFEQAFAAMVRERADGVIVQTSVGNFNNRQRIAALSIKYRLPTICGLAEFALAGVLLTYGVNIVEMWRRAAVYVDKILKGANPGDLAIDQATKFELVINLKTAKALGLTIPPSLLQRADQVIDP